MKPRGFGGRRTYRKPVSRDKNHAEIVSAFQQLGCTVADLAGVGGGCPDILVGFRGRDRLVEIKQPAGPKGGLVNRHVELTDEQVGWHGAWKGFAPTVIRTTADVAYLVQTWAAQMDIADALERSYHRKRADMIACGEIPWPGEKAPSALQEPRGEAIAPPGGPKVE
jgi:hypothetical protein